MASSPLLLSKKTSGVPAMQQTKITTEYINLPSLSSFVNGTDDCHKDADESNESFAVYSTGDTSSATVVLLLHGAGQTFHSFSLLIQYLDIWPMHIMGIDLRAHGRTQAYETNLDVNVLLQDIALVLEKMIITKTTNNPEIEKISLVLVGHSIGGSLVTKFAECFDRKNDPALHIHRNPTDDDTSLHADTNPTDDDTRLHADTNPTDDDTSLYADTSQISDAVHRIQEKGANVCAVIAIDTIEEATRKGFERLEEYLLSRPDRFNSIEDAIKWHLRSGIIQLKASADASVPSMLTQVATEDPKSSQVKWRTNLLASQSHWNGWIESFSTVFADKLRVPRCLIVSRPDHLDTPLLKGQMSGKFSVEVVAGTGHQVHEDRPDVCARAIIRFLQRYGLLRSHIDPKTVHNQTTF